MTRVALVCTLAVAALAALTSPAGAVIAGPNGPMIFTSGRGGAAGDDNNAKIYLVNSPGGAAIQLTFGTTRHSHPNWSPDRTKIAYSKSVTGAGARDIWIRDLITGADTQVTNTTTADEDRASWSPDGTKIAYGVRAAADPAGATEQSDIIIDSNLAAAGGATPLTNTSDDSEDKPVWSPDGEFIYYARDTTTPYNDDNDIVREPAGGGSIASIVANSMVNEWQPALSPDGTKVCYSRGGTSDSGPTGVDVYVANTNGLNSNITLFKTASTTGEFNCVWSPDGMRIGYTFGVFSNGALLTAPSDGSAGVSTITDSPMHFDGNSDWTFNPLPTCSNGAASVGFNSFVSIPLSCTDAVEPTDNEPQGVEKEIVTTPPNGVLGALDNETVIYTPNVNFQGQDSFTFKGTNQSFGGDTATSSIATIAVTVSGPAGAPGATVDALSVSPRRWRRGSALPTFSQSPVGTTIGVRLSAAGRVTLSFRRARPGRRVRGRCVRPTQRNRNRRRCTRHVRAGALSFDGKLGANSVRFQGRLSARKRLALGRYRVSARVTAGGQTSPSRSVSFRIVRR